MMKKLVKNGWMSYWHKDNWIRKDYDYSNPDWAGVSLSEAYKICLIEETQKEFKND